MTDELERLQRWYASQCDGDWEHTYGLTIATLDNPGWSVDIQLSGTELEDREFSALDDLESEQAWVVCDVVDRTFRGRGGPGMLTRILRTFVDWAEASVANRPLGG
jgi:hypothetical protein